jgi:CBS domain
VAHVRINVMTIAPRDPIYVADDARGTRPQAMKETNSTQQRRRKTAIVSWYGGLLIFSMLLVAAGWEIFRWILAIITLGLSVVFFSPQPVFRFDVAKVLIEKGISRFPVLDSIGKGVGTLTERDLVHRTFGALGSKVRERYRDAQIEQRF